MSRDDEKLNSTFIDNLSSTLAIKSEYEVKNYDYEWLDMIDKTIPYLENILNNPKRFIVDEEEVVKVELAKKITPVSVIHLTQHTDLIQDFDKDSGEVVPSKILNVNKEESLDTYENRFICTLVNNIMYFIEQRTANIGDNGYIDKKNIFYEGCSKVGNEDVNISVHLTSSDVSNSGSSNGQNGVIFERIKKIKKKVSGFMASELMQNLSMLHVAPVKSPIKKTNVILKNPNFQRAEALWNYINSYVSNDKDERINKDYYDQGALKEKYDQAFLMSFLANDSINKKDRKIVSKEQMISDVFDKVIERVIESDELLTDDSIQELFSSRVKAVRHRNSELALQVYGVFVETFDAEIKKIEEVFNLLGC